MDYTVAKQGMADALPAILAAREGLRRHRRNALGEAVTTLLAAGTAAGQVREDAGPNDVLMALGGIRLISAHERRRHLASRLIALLLDVLAATHATTPGTT